MSYNEITLEPELGFNAMSEPAYSSYDEELIADDRARLTPAQQVERKLFSLLKTAPLFVSHSQTAIQRR